MTNETFYFYFYPSITHLFMSNTTCILTLFLSIKNVIKFVVHSCGVGNLSLIPYLSVLYQNCVCFGKEATQRNLFNYNFNLLINIETLNVFKTFFLI